jgi:phosphoglucosamine mutase
MASTGTDRLFGTDGVRGRAGVPPLDPATIRRIGAALVHALRRGEGMPRILIGRDPRESSGWIERELARGATAAGARVTSAGVLPTPAVAYLTFHGGFDAGCVVSASHNPYQDNGIKIFSGEGAKAGDELERAIEARVVAERIDVPADAPLVVEAQDFTAAYLAHLKTVWPPPRRLDGWRLVVDCANGATSAVAPRLLRELGADVVAIHCAPDGRNINADCGATHPETIARAVVAHGATLGVAFDGDGDRAVFVDHEGRLVDGDAVLLMAARYLKACGRLAGEAVVATVMSNLGLERALAELGIAVVRCPVGDRFVAEEMRRRGLVLGGEQSGHVIFADHLFTGDGLVTVLMVLRILAESGQPLRDLAALPTCPQVLVSVPVARRADLATQPTLGPAMRRIAQALEGRGRLVVRYSGTESLLRIMIEGPDAEAIRGWARELADAAQRDLG